MKEFTKQNWFSLLVLGVILPWATWVTSQISLLRSDSMVFVNRLTTIEMIVAAGRLDRLDFQKDVIDRLARIETEMKFRKP